VYHNHPDLPPPADRFPSGKLVPDLGLGSNELQARSHEIFPTSGAGRAVPAVGAAAVAAVCLLV
jgi:hypothetical protein